MSLSPEQERLANIFFPYDLEKIASVRRDKARFVHYTTAGAAMSILRNREVWMRNASTMNDFMEVQHGMNCLTAAYNNGSSGKRFKNALNDVFTGITNEIEKTFNIWNEDFKKNTYLICVSEHEQLEDNLGRLSMWRAYSESAGVAIVMDATTFLNPIDVLKAYTTPVAYLSDRDFDGEFEKVANNIAAEKDFLKSLEREIIADLVFRSFKWMIIRTKHPGFREEREWRVVYSPSMDVSTQLQKDIQVIRGVPQTIYKIFLRDIPDEGLIGIEIPLLVKRIIIGPSQFPLVLYQAFCDLLSEVGVDDPESKVVVSDIPLRR
jgi:hypothetical protein